MQLIEDRRALHQIPELDRTLSQTMEYLTNALRPLRCRLFAPIESSLCAYFDFGQPRTIAFRSDADALPITERTGLPFSSRHPGRMHACGHDGHMAMLLELARRLHAKEAFHCNVLLVFQPAEETTGGALDLCKSGVFSQYHVEAIFGMHLWPDLPAGVIASRKNEMMSRSCELTVEITGRSSHIAKAREGIDALAAGVALYQQVAELEASFPQNIFRLCKFGRMQSGSVCNAISSHTRLEGSIRAFQDEVFFGLINGVRRIGADLAAQTGCTITVEANEGYPAVMNPPALYDRIRNDCGIPFEELAKPSMTAEDFSWYQTYLPGMFFFLGVGPAPALHADHFTFDERILQQGADFWELLATRYQ